MEYIFLGIVVLVLLINILIVFKVFSIGNNNYYEKSTQFLSDKIAESEHRQIKMLQDNRVENSEKFERISAVLNKNIVEFQDRISSSVNRSNIALSESLTNNFNSLNKRIDDNLNNINKRVEDRLNEGFTKTNATFNNILERLSKIDEAQKKIDSLSTNIISLQEVLTDKKSRGMFGEVQLNNILVSIFGENNEKIYKIQKKLSTGVLADVAVNIPAPIGMMCIDSKFPLENYRRLIDKTLPESERLQAEKDFKINIKKHINDIGEKYIISGETADQAVMFVPAEAVFAEINAYHQDLVDYAGTKKVWIASPTTLMAVLSTVQVVLKNIEREKYSSVIHQELNKLGDEFKRYKTRWASLAKDIKKVSVDVEQINTTSEKIEKKFSNIAKVQIEPNSNETTVQKGLIANFEEYNEDLSDMEDF